ncbi:hypothetical protein KNP414_07727 [Paenibacillus mucilaginosus KNP414]|uniref:Glucose/Sorbosone dehydrogenase domain-containing protein n=1 Tax=Paenibacillus mucilaginosus (strain KNP414) TaxID=1036673 RepID=F8FEX8_PAEMK|nr:hypothetical protein KNP414_07727 [Paenibacillus mucilaginosus KNP414]
MVEGPDGPLYALANNRDGGGNPHDDKIIRLKPAVGVK